MQILRVCREEASLEQEKPVLHTQLSQHSEKSIHLSPLTKQNFEITCQLTH